MQIPDKDIKFPIANYARLCFLKNIVISIITYDYIGICDDIFEKA